MHPRVAPVVILLVSLTAFGASSVVAQVGPSQQSSGRGLVGVDASGQRTFSISGRVLDEATNQPLDRAHVVLGLFTGMYLQEAYVDINGAFLFSDLSRGSYYVTASHPDYEEKQERVQVVSGPVAGVFIYLSPRPRMLPPVLIEPLDVAQHLIPKAARKEFEKGVEEYNRRNFGEAQAYFDKAVELHPAYVSALHARGLCSLRLGDIEAARSWFERAIELNANVAAPRIFLGGIYNAQQRYAEAEQHLVRAVQLNPQSWLAHFELSRAYWALENLQGAEEAIGRAHELNPNIPQVHLMRANVFLARQDYEGALGEMDEFLKLAPTGPLPDQVRQKQAQIRAQRAAAKGP